VTIEGNTIYGNKLAGYEQLGAIGIDGGIPGAPTVISRNTIIGIQGKYGIYVQDWSYGLSVIITGNEILKSGADAFWAIQTLRTEHCLIAGNIVADNRGYGVFDSSWRSSTFFGNIVMGNSGRGLVLDGSMEQPILVQDNRVSDNSGTGIFCIYAKYPIIISNDIFGNMNFGMEVNEALHGGILSCNIIAGNGSGGWGGGALIVNSYISFLGNTVVGNEAAVGGGGLEVSGVAVAVANNIFWDNRAPVGRSIWVRASRPHPQTHVSYSSVASGSDELLLEGSAILGPGNIDVDPLFVDPGHWDDAGTPDDTSDDVFIPGDYHLLPGSPCIDAGTNDVDNPDTPETETLPDTDIAGIPRVIDGDLDGVATVDIGAYEYLPGDLNHDGKVNVLDLLLVRNSLGCDPASSIEARKADVNADGAVNVEDLIMVRGRLAR